MGGLDVGSWPAWLSAIITSVSAVTAVVTYRRSVKDKEGEQATRISAWTTEATDISTMQPGRILFVANNSDTGVFELTITPFAESSRWWGFLAAGAEESIGLDAVPESQKEEARSVKVPVISGVKLQVDFPRGEPFPQMEFRDAAGRWWQRDGNGKIRRGRPKDRAKITLTQTFFGINIQTIEYDPSSENPWKVSSLLHRHR